MTTATNLTLLPAAPEGVEWTTRSLTILDPGMSFERFEELLAAAGEFKTASSFWIGDLILYGEARYGERYAQAIEATGLSYSTLSDYVYVCKQIGSKRRRPGLRFGHHATVAKLEPADQDAWLAKAEEHGWTRDELRDAIRAAGQLVQRPARLPARQEVLDAPATVEAVRNISDVRDALSMTKTALDGGTVVGLEERLPAALRAADALTATVQAAAARLARPSLLEASERVVRQATRSSGFAMVPTEVFEAFAATVAAERST